MAPRTVDPTAPAPMPDYRRNFVPGGTYFFTLKTERNAPIFSDPNARRLLGRTLRAANLRWPFEAVATVLLPDHLHTIWTLPPGDDRYPARWAWIKKEFTKAWLDSGGGEQWVSESRRRNRRRGVWQRRFWEHTLRDEQDFDRHFDYIHFNPVKHGYAPRPGDWPHSTFLRWVRRGVYPPEWATDHPPNIPDTDATTGE